MGSMKTSLNENRNRSKATPLWKIQFKTSEVGNILFLPANVFYTNELIRVTFSLKQATLENLERKWLRGLKVAQCVFLCVP